MRIAVIGDEGSGKSLAMTAMGTLLADVYGVKLGANYPIFGQKSFELIETMKQLREFTGGVLLLDEVWLLMDSRNPRENVEFSRWVRQTRKKGLLIFYATQSMDQVDKRMRHSTSMVMLCQKARGKIKLHFCSSSTGNVIKTFTIANPSLFYGLYDTNAVVDLMENV